MNEKDSGLLPLGDILKQAVPRELGPHLEVATRMLKPLTRVQNRLLDPCPEHDLEICFQHSVLCQTGSVETRLKSRLGTAFPAL